MGQKRKINSITSVQVKVAAACPWSGVPPGRLVDIGGRKIHMICTGKGSPTVILEAGASSFAIDWTLVQAEIARTNRVCSYDRAASGFSDPATGGPRGGVTVDLHAALQLRQRANLVRYASLRTTSSRFVTQSHTPLPTINDGEIIVNPSLRREADARFSRSVSTSG